MVDCENLQLFSTGWRRDHAAMRGAVLCLLSAAAFGTLGIFGRLASDAGAEHRHDAARALRRSPRSCSPPAAARPAGWRRCARLPRRVVLTGLGLGAAGYSLQSGLYFAAIGRLDVSLVALLLYTYPAFVTIAALALGRARAVPADRRGAHARVLRPRAIHCPAAAAASDYVLLSRSSTASSRRWLKGVGGGLAHRGHQIWREPAVLEG